MQKTLLAFFMLLTASWSCAAEDYAVKDDAVMIVAMVVRMIAINRDDTFEEINERSRRWIHADLYPVVYDMNGKCLAHGQKKELIGKNLIDLSDADGREYIKERIRLAHTKKKFWQNYKFTDPVTKKIMEKSTYCARSGEYIICSGIYRR